MELPLRAPRGPRSPRPWTSPLACCWLLAATAPAEELGSRLERLASEAAAPGLAVGVVRQGELVFARAFGTADIESAAAVTVGTQFEIGSLSKPLTAMVVMRLVEQGRIRLDDTADRWLGERARRWGSVTVRQLLTHTSGIPDYEKVAGYEVYHAPARLETILDIVAGQPDSFPAGEGFEYSNTGYYLLSEIVERAASRPLAELLDEIVFRPLGMSSSSLRLPERRPEVLATGHERADGGEFLPRPPIVPSSTRGAGGVRSTVPDLARWDAALRSSAVLSAESRERMWERTRLADGTPVGYGLGWALDEFRGARRVRHDGRTAGFSADFHHFPDHGVSIIALANANAARTSAIVKALTLDFLPSLRYDALPVPAESDEARTRRHLSALRQAVLGEGDLDLLHDGMREFATAPHYEPLRVPLEGPLREGDRFVFLRSKTETSTSGSELRHFLYELTWGDSVLYWTIVMREGKMTALNWEEE